MIPVNKIENLIKIYADLEKELSSGSVDKKEYASKSKKYSSLGSVINQAREYLNFEKEKIDLEKIINDNQTDNEMKDMAKNEIKNIITKKKINEKILKVFLIPKDEADEKNAIVEIRKLTSDSSGLLRTCAYGALGHLEVKESAKELHQGIFDSNLEAVKSAAYALARIGEKISDKEIEVLHKLDESEFRKILKFFN